MLRLCPDLQPAVTEHMAGGGKFVRAGLVLTATAAAGAEEAVGIRRGRGDRARPQLLAHPRRHHRSRPRAPAPAHDVGRARCRVTPSSRATRLRPLPSRSFWKSRRPSGVRRLDAARGGDPGDDRRAGRGHGLRAAGLAVCRGVPADGGGQDRGPALVLHGDGRDPGRCPGGHVEALAEFGRHLGIAFQAIDDVLGIWGEPGVTGKPVGNDLRQHKKTLPVRARPCSRWCLGRRPFPAARARPHRGRSRQRNAAARGSAGPRRRPWPSERRNFAPHWVRSNECPSSSGPVPSWRRSPGM